MFGLYFKDSDALLKRLSKEWDAIPPKMIMNLYELFRARCAVCSRINDESINGHWKEHES